MGGLAESLVSASNLFKTNPGIVLWCMGIDCLYDLAVKLSHGLVEDRQPVSLSTEDALTVGWAWAPWSVQFSTSTGMDAPIKAAGITTCTMEWVGMCMPVSFMHNVATPSDDRNLAFCLLFLELLEAPEKLPDFVLGGVLNVLGRPRCHGPPHRRREAARVHVHVHVRCRRRVRDHPPPSVSGRDGHD